MGIACCKAAPLQNVDGGEWRKHYELTSVCSPVSRSQGHPLGPKTPRTPRRASGSRSTRAYPPSKAGDVSERDPLRTRREERSSRGANGTDSPELTARSPSPSPLNSKLISTDGGDNGDKSTPLASSRERFLPGLRSPEAAPSPSHNSKASSLQHRRNLEESRAGPGMPRRGQAVTHVHVMAKDGSHSTSNIDPNSAASLEPTDSIASASGRQSPLIAPPPKTPQRTPRDRFKGGLQPPLERNNRKARSSGYGAVSPTPDTTKSEALDSPPSGSIAASPGTDPVPRSIGWSPKPMHWRDGAVAQDAGATDEDAVAMVKGPAGMGPAAASTGVERTEMEDAIVDGSSNTKSSEQSNPVETPQDSIVGQRQSVQRNVSASLRAGFGSALSHSQQQQGLASIPMEPYSRQPDANRADYKRRQAPATAADSLLEEREEDLSLAVGPCPGGSSRTAVTRAPGGKGSMEASDSLHISEPQLSPMAEMHVPESNMQSSFMYEDRRVQAAQSPPLASGNNRSLLLNKQGMLMGDGDTVAFEPTAELTLSVVDKIGTVQNSWFERESSGAVGATLSEGRLKSPASHHLSPRSGEYNSALLAQMKLTQAGTPTASAASLQHCAMDVSPHAASPHNQQHLPQASPREQNLLFPSPRDAYRCRATPDPPAGRVGAVESEFSAMTYGSASDGDEPHESRGGIRNAVRNLRSRAARNRRTARRQQQGSRGKGGTPTRRGEAGPPFQAIDPIVEDVLSAPESEGRPAGDSSPLVAERLTPTRRTSFRHSRRGSAAASPMYKQGSGAARMNEAVMRIGSSGLDATPRTPVTATSSARGRDSTRNRDLVQEAEMQLSSPQAKETIEKVIGGPVSPAREVDLVSVTEGVPASPAEADVEGQDQQGGAELLQPAHPRQSSSRRRPVRPPLALWPTSLLVFVCVVQHCVSW
jgi:hypothetical protein